ncbi:hypothetical protein KI387_027457, partial [Taxus chinensis]
IDERIIKAVTLEHGDDIDSAVEFFLNEVIPKQSAPIVSEKFDHTCGSVDNLSSNFGFWADSQQQSHDDYAPELFDEIILAGENPIKFDVHGAGSSLSVNLVTDGEVYNEVKTNSPSPSERSNLFKQFYGETYDGEYGLSGESNISQFRAEIENMQLTGMQSIEKNSVDVEDYGFDNFGFKEETDEIGQEMSSEVSSICDSLRGIANASDPEGENQSMLGMVVGGISCLPAYIETTKSHDAEPIISFDAFDSLEKGFIDNLPVSQSFGANIDRLSVYNKENSIYRESDTKDSFSSVQSSILSCNGSSSSCVDTNSLEGVVSEAKKNKEVLVEGMDSIRSLWRKTHCEEAVAQHAKEEAANGGMEILAKVEELRLTLARAKESNDMHAGEVYGERAILATEARELQSRITQLAAEKDSALRMINEMCGALQARYDAARKEREAALEEKMKKEETARKVLALEESVMAKVAQDSRDLELEAETNTKLREFLIDHGHSVDSLQGELSVLYQDVKVLKEQIDGGIAMVASGFWNAKLAASPKREDVNQHYRSLALDDLTTLDVSIASEHQSDCKPFSGNDDFDASRFHMLHSSHESGDAQFASNSLHDSIGNMKTPSPIASYERLVNSVPNTSNLLTGSLVGHLGNGVERSTSEADLECHDGSLKSSNHSGEARKEHSFEQLSDEDGWQMLDSDNEGSKKSGSDNFPSLSSLGKAKSKQS